MEFRNSSIVYLKTTSEFGLVFKALIKMYELKHKVIQNGEAIVMIADQHQE